jgi:hypothetical protein
MKNFLYLSGGKKFMILGLHERDPKKQGLHYKAKMVAASQWRHVQLCLHKPLGAQTIQHSPH